MAEKTVSGREGNDPASACLERRGHAVDVGTELAVFEFPRQPVFCPVDAKIS